MFDFVIRLKHLYIINTLNIENIFIHLLRNLNINPILGIANLLPPMFMRSNQID